MTNFNGGLAKPPLKRGQDRVISSHKNYAMYKVINP